MAGDRSDKTSDRNGLGSFSTVGSKGNSTATLSSEKEKDDMYSVL